MGSRWNHKLTKWHSTTVEPKLKWNLAFWKGLSGRTATRARPIHGTHFEVEERTRQLSDHPHPRPKHEHVRPVAFRIGVGAERLVVVAENSRHPADAAIRSLSWRLFRQRRLLAQTWIPISHRRLEAAQRRSQLDLSETVLRTRSTSDVVLSASIRRRRRTRTRPRRLPYRLRREEQSADGVAGRRAVLKIYPTKNIDLAVRRNFASRWKEFVDVVVDDVANVVQQPHAGHWTQHVLLLRPACGGKLHLVRKNLVVVIGLTMFGQREHGLRTRGTQHQRHPNK